MSSSWALSLPAHGGQFHVHFDGAAPPLLAHLESDPKLTEKERRELRRLIDGAE
jgi:hypothetical protein